MISLFDLFKVGIGPSSSHTVGPMRAAVAFRQAVLERAPHAAALRVTLFGSLAWTGVGHASDRAVILGLAGEEPESVDPARIDAIVAQVSEQRAIALPTRSIAFDPARDIVFDRATATPVHPNTLMFEALTGDGAVQLRERWCSVGGGFIVRECDCGADVVPERGAVPFPFTSAVELLTSCAAHDLTIAELVLANEVALRPEAEVIAGIDRLADTMMACIDRGMTSTEACLPGKLHLKRRAPALARSLERRAGANRRAPHETMDHISLFALAVNEENAAGGRVVTAPTNGAAGVLPAVLRYYRDLWPDADREGMRTFLLTATAIGALLKMNASISGAEVGCQGEIGSASSMAAAGLAAAAGATPAQVENAAEIAMEHHLGMTCDPVGGLVQVPCIERNAFGAIKAVTAASLALHGDGSHFVSLDQVIETMRQTGADMQAKYKETSLGGLAVNFIEC